MPAVRQAARRSAATASITGRRAVIDPGVNARAMSERMRVWSGGSSDSSDHRSCS